MDDETPEIDQSAFAEAELRSREEGNRMINRGRFIIALAVPLGSLACIHFLNLEFFEDTRPIAIIYAVFAAFFHLGGKRWPWIVRLSRYAIPFVDIPLLVIMASRHQTHWDEPRVATAIFTVILAFLVLLSSFGMRRRHVFLTAVVGASLYVMMAIRVEMQPFGVGAPVLLLFTFAWLSSEIPLRYARMHRETAERQLQRNRLARYFSPGIAEKIEQHDLPGEGESCDLTVLFNDIRGFTKMSENMSSAEVVKVLNRYHSVMVREIFRYGGTLDKYLGDGLLVYFNSPVRQTDHAERAVKCALAMKHALTEFNDHQRAENLPELAIGIGLHSGEAIVGNIGAPHRREFTAIGDTVNVASRLEALTKTKGVPILVSEAVVDRIEVDGTGTNFTDAGEVEIRGREGKLNIFSVG